MIGCCTVRDCQDFGSSVKADCPWTFRDRQDFLAGLTDEHAENLRLLGAVPLFHELPDSDYAGLSKICQRVFFQAGESLITEGDSVSAFFLILSGEAQLQLAGGERLQLAKGDFLGEEALLQAVPSSFTLTASTPLHALKIERAAFRQRAHSLKSRPMPSIAPDETGVSTWGSAFDASLDSARQNSGLLTPRLSSRHAPKEEEKILRRDLVTLGLLGIGSFGFVDLVEHTPTGETYALKTISKGILQKRELRGPRYEKLVMRMTSSRFLVRLITSFSTSQVTYLLLEPALGGELWTVYHKQRLFGKKDHAKYYSACMSCAFEHLHARRIVYRDLKLENVLLDARGQAKLCDFGFSKFVVGKTYSTVGTPEYFAPEMIRGIGHSVGLDWWTLAVFIYEMLAGFSPFAATDAPRIYRNVLAGVEQLWFPPPCQGLAKDILQKLFVAEPTQRLPMQRPYGILYLQQHSWYSGLDWEALKEGTLRAPHEPVVKDSRDLENFMSNESQKPEMVTYVPAGSEEISDSDREAPYSQKCESSSSDARPDIST